MWIAIGICVGVFAVILLIDNRKKIFKFKKLSKKETKVEKKVEAKTEEPAKKEKKINSKISFEEHVPENVSFERLDLNDKAPLEYSYGPRTQMSRRPQMMNDFPSPIRRSYNKKKTIKEQIKELSPEMKGVLLSNALGKKDNF